MWRFTGSAPFVFGAVIIKIDKNVFNDDNYGKRWQQKDMSEIDMYRKQRCQRAKKDANNSKMWTRSACKMKWVIWLEKRKTCQHSLGHSAERIQSICTISIPYALPDYRLQCSHNAYSIFQIKTNKLHKRKNEIMLKNLSKNVCSLEMPNTSRDKSNTFL